MKDDQDQDFPGYLWIPGRARWKINFGPKVHRTWKNRHLVPIWFPHSSSTSLYDLPFLGAKSHLKEGRPWMTFLSRSNEGRRFFQFAIENFKRRSLKCCRIKHWKSLKLWQSSFPTYSFIVSSFVILILSFWEAFPDFVLGKMISKWRTSTP